MKMRIQEILNDDEINELSLLVVDARQALMVQAIPNDLDEAYRRQVLRTPVRPVKYVPKPRPLPKPKPLYSKPQPARTSMISRSQTNGINPKVDVTKGKGFKLNNFNPIPPMTDLDRRLYDMNNGQKKSSF